MINCERLKALIPESTCIARQRMIQSGKKWAGRTDMVLSCGGCEIGEKILEKDKVKADKSCTKCGAILPSTLKYFDPAPRSMDKLTNKCKVCRAKEAGVELSPPPPVKPKKTKSHKVPASHERKKLYIDISAVPGLYSALKEKADDEMRTPLAQALWILKEELI